MSEAVEKRRARFSPEVLEQMQKLGRMISAETYGEGGPPVELTWNEIEELGHEIGKLTATEFDQTVQRQQAERYDTQRDCPQCGKACRASVKHRDLTTRDGTADLSEPEFQCVAWEGPFFPQRIELRLDGSDYSPAVLERIVVVGGSSKSFAVATKMFHLLTNLKVSQRTINNKTIAIGGELKAARDALTDAHFSRPVTQRSRVTEPAVSLAVAQVDGGRMQTRQMNCGSGVHHPHWRESKNAGLFRMTGKTFKNDPHPQLPSCFTSPKQMAGLLHGTGDLSPSDQAKPDLSWRPKSLVRTCLSSLCSSDRFGEMMGGEAEQRGLYRADRRAFLGDGLAYNWTIQQTHFETFTPILDFIHPIERLHELSRVLFEDADEAWQNCGKWIELCWQGDVTEVIGMLQAENLIAVKRLSWQTRMTREPNSSKRLVTYKTMFHE